ncbi:hypothetical protein BASA81_006301 [Batrachochytrium salamandrivorans]|nr:hypothetical protein BASA81_006301 [Batrachochytrium salamandrivorans]
MDFAAAVALVEGSGRAVFSSADLVQLEALHKQATFGNQPDGDNKDLVWKALDGVTREEAETSKTTPHTGADRGPGRLTLHLVVSPLLGSGSGRASQGADVDGCPAPTHPVPPRGRGQPRIWVFLFLAGADGQPGRIKFGQILRCGQLSEASSEDTHWLVNEFAIKTLLDLRSVHHTLDGPLAEHFTEHIQITLPSHSPPLKLAIGRVLRRVASALPGIELVLAPMLRAVEQRLHQQVTILSSHLFTHGGLSTVFSSILLQDKDNLMSSALRVAVIEKCIHWPSTVHLDIVEDFVLSHDYVFTTERGEREWQGLIKEFPKWI